MVTYVLAIVVVALIFDFINGFHDSANSIATIVGTRVLSPFAAVCWAAFFNFAALFVIKLAVAKAVATGFIDPAIVTPNVICGALLGAIAWNLITWWLGLPTSSSHALIGGFVGSALVAVGPKAVLVPGVIKIVKFIVISPMVGMALGFLFMTVTYRLFQHATPHRVDRLFRRLQLFSAAAFSLGHGGNDAQKTMGIITALLYATGHLTGEFHVPLWVVLSSHAAIALGTMSGGWRIVKTMGMKLTKLQPVGGFCAETAGAITLFATTLTGIPVSTTHTITGAIVGVGATRRLSAVKWGIAGRIVWAWVLTLPMSALVASLTYLTVKLFVRVF